MVAELIDDAARLTSGQLAARLRKLCGDAGPIDQLRAGVLLSLLQGQDPGAGAGAAGAVVDIRIDFTTLAGLDDRSVELAGFGPVLEDIGRQVAERQEGAEWRFAVTHPGTGRPVHVGTTRRRPTAAKRRGIEAGYLTCIFPACRMPARRCDLDHRIPWSEGSRTCECSQFPACRYHHGLRHKGVGGTTCRPTATSSGTARSATATR